jgi:hypothetical protein
VQSGYIKKSGNAVAFLNVASMQLHHKNCEQLCVGSTFENQMLGFGRIANSIFSLMEKKRAEQCRGIMGNGKVGANQKYVPYTYKKITCCSTYQRTPYFHGCLLDSALLLCILDIFLFAVYGPDGV